MDVLRTGCSLLGSLEPENSFSQTGCYCRRLLAIFPSVLLYWYHYSTSGKRISTTGDAESQAGHFLTLLHGKKPDETMRRALDVSEILYGEHEFNASTFACRVCAATLSDFYLHHLRHWYPPWAAARRRKRSGDGAHSEIQDPRRGSGCVIQMLERKEKIMGFGHAVYKHSDPRNAIIKEWALKIGRPSVRRLLVRRLR